MGGRSALTTPVDALRQLFPFTERPNLAPRYTVAPTRGCPDPWNGRSARFAQD